MVSSIFGVIIYGFTDGSEPSSEVGLQGIRFRTQQGRWVTQINGAQISLQHNPQTLQTTAPLPFTLAPLSSSQKIYLTKQPGESTTIAEAELYVNLKPLLPQLFFACTSDGEKCENLPLRTCADATPITPVIFLTLGDTPNAILENNCYTISGDISFLTTTIDTIILTLIGVLP